MIQILLLLRVSIRNFQSIMKIPAAPTASKGNWLCEDFYGSTKPPYLCHSPPPQLISVLTQSSCASLTDFLYRVGGCTETGCPGVPLMNDMLFAFCPTVITGFRVIDSQETASFRYLEICENPVPTWNTLTWAVHYGVDKLDFSLGGGLQNKDLFVAPMGAHPGIPRSQLDTPWTRGPTCVYQQQIQSSLNISLGIMFWPTLTHIHKLNSQRIA